MQGGDDLEGFFAFNAQRTLEAPSGKLSILVDETSMLDMSLASSLLDAIPTDIPVQLVLVGEPACIVQNYWGCKFITLLCKLVSFRILTSALKLQLLPIPNALAYRCVACS